MFYTDPGPSWDLPACIFLKVGCWLLISCSLALKCRKLSISRDKTHINEDRILSASRGSWPKWGACFMLPGSCRVSSCWCLSSGSEGPSWNTGRGLGQACPLWPPYCLPSSPTFGASCKPFRVVHLAHSHGQFHQSETLWCPAYGHRFSTASPGFPWLGSGEYQSH